MNESMAMNDYLWGGITVACLSIGLCFLRFWKGSRDRLFLFFAFAFGVLGVNWFLLAVFQPPSEARHYFYLVRLLAFLLIIAGILDKNLTQRRL